MLFKIKKIITIFCLLSIFSSFYSFANYSFANFKPLDHFGDNPGDLTASYYQPSPSAKVIVMFLHGCVQNAQELAKQSGFVELAIKHNFILLLPQQKQKNNVKSCFNWFSDLDSEKDAGESLSLKNMIISLKEQSKIEQVYIAGLSAGGAMTSAMLANYPDLFVAGAVIAGLPYPCANDLIKAIACMRSGPSQSVEELVNFVRSKQSTIKQATIKQSTIKQSIIKQWPKLIVVTGDKDKVVSPKNSMSLALQWAKLGSAQKSTVKINRDDHQISEWLTSNNETQVKLIEINNIGHGMSVDPSSKDGGIEAVFLPVASINTAKAIVDFWGI